MTAPLRFVYFGTPVFAVAIAEMLRANGIVPSLVVTTPEKPVGRKLLLTKTPMHEWAIQNHIPVCTPATLRTEEITEVLERERADIFLVVAYGKMIPEHMLRMPRIATLNIHPSLLPKFRGPSPVESTIIAGDTTTGVTLMELDTEMDHGPVILQESLNQSWDPSTPPTSAEIEHALASIAGKILIGALPGIEEHIKHKQEQAHTQATYCKKIEKEDGLVDIHGDPIIAIRKIRAYHLWPGAFFFLKHNEKDIRIKITQARVEHHTLIIEKVIPEGKKEMFYADFLRGLH